MNYKKCQVKLSYLSNSVLIFSSTFSSYLIRNKFIPLFLQKFGKKDATIYGGYMNCRKTTDGFIFFCTKSFKKTFGKKVTILSVGTERIEVKPMETQTSIFLPRIS